MKTKLKGDNECKGSRPLKRRMVDNQSISVNCYLVLYPGRSGEGSDSGDSAAFVSSDLSALLS